MSSALSSQLMIAITSAPNNAAPNPLIVKPGTSHAASARQTAFTTKMNSPSVSERHRQGQHDQQRPDDRVHQAEDDPAGQRRAGSAHADAGNQLRREKDRHRIEEHA